jgi:hypothetical protein
MASARFGIWIQRHYCNVLGPAGGGRRAKRAGGHSVRLDEKNEHLSDARHSTAAGTGVSSLETNPEAREKPGACSDRRETCV